MGPYPDQRHSASSPISWDCPSINANRPLHWPQNFVRVSYFLLAWKNSLWQIWKKDTKSIAGWQYWKQTNMKLMVNLHYFHAPEFVGLVSDWSQSCCVTGLYPFLYNSSIFNVELHNPFVILINKWYSLYKSQALKGEPASSRTIGIRERKLRHFVDNNWTQCARALNYSFVWWSMLKWYTLV